MVQIPGAKTTKKNTNSTQNKSQTHHAKQYEVTSFLSTDCELSTETCSKNVYRLGPWTLTKQAQNKLAAAQTKMERSMLNITYKDRRTNIWVRERTKLIDIIYTVRKMK